MTWFRRFCFLSDAECLHTVGVIFQASSHVSSCLPFVVLGSSLALFEPRVILGAMGYAKQAPKSQPASVFSLEALSQAAGVDPQATIEHLHML